nr:helix-turn-helix transcriptional regulator [uncultured Dyadobacter sp.]
MEAFASNLRRFRAERDFSQSYMALLLEMTEASYSELEDGSSLPSVPVLKLLSQVFKTPVTELISDLPLRETAHRPSGVHFTPELLSEADKDTYIRILENQLRILLAKKNG